MYNQMPYVYIYCIIYIYVYMCPDLNYSYKTYKPINECQPWINKPQTAV